MTTTWEIVRWLHLLAMAFFVGGQFVLAAAVVPSFRGIEDRTQVRAVARRFGWGSVAALCVLLATGAAMAEHFSRWGDRTLQIKLVLVAIAGLLVLIHLRRRNEHWLEGLIFVVSLVIVWLGMSLAH